MFTDLLFELRQQGVRTGTQEWLALHRALSEGLIDGADALYTLGRALLVHTEAHYDAWDVAFARVFEGLDDGAVRAAIDAWLQQPIPPNPEAFAAITGLDLDALRKAFEETLRQQKERHDGGNRWVGTGGASPWGHGGKHPAGIRVGGSGGGRSAVQVAAERNFRDFRDDAVLDVRSWKVALRELRRLGREGPEQLSVPRTIDATCQDGGEIRLEFERERKNTVRLLLFLDSGGSMDPYTSLVEQLLTAASESNHWKSLDVFHFHNCVYGRVWKSLDRGESVQTADLLQHHPETSLALFVGDACMAPWELTAVGGALSLWDHNARTGFEWLAELARRWPRRAWLNPEPERTWRHPTIQAIGRLYPMFPLTVDGLRHAVKTLGADPKPPPGVDDISRLL